MTSRQSLSRIVQLARTITESVDEIDQALVADGIESPSFDEDALFNIPLELSSHKDALLDATAELHDILLEPLDLIHIHGGHNNSLCLLAIAEFSLADKVPLHGEASFEAIAKGTPLTLDMTTRLLRHAMTMRVFRETFPGKVGHTAASRLLHKSAANDWLRSGTTEMWPAAVKTLDALKKWPGSQEANETGFSLANNASETIYQTLSNDEDRAWRFAKGMKVFSDSPQFDLAYTTDHYDWKSLGKAQVIDVGGSSGHVSLALARKFSDLYLVVQDMEKMIANTTVPEDVRGQVSFMAHDIFSPQPVKDADVYYLRWILHNWSDKYCGLILRALLPALKPGARVIIHEVLMPEPGAAAMWKEKYLRSLDLNMAGVFNAKERTKNEFVALFKEADQAFALQAVIEPKGSALQMLEFIWQGEK